MAPVSIPNTEHEYEYYARRSREEWAASVRASTQHARALHQVLAETYAELATMLAGSPQPLGEHERLCVGLAIAAGLAAHTRCPDAREYHRAIAAEYRRRMKTSADAPGTG
jgi:hypothetical protein